MIDNHISILFDFVAHTVHVAKRQVTDRHIAHRTIRLQRPAFGTNKLLAIDLDYCFGKCEFPVLVSKVSVETIPCTKLKCHGR